ncbi:type II toxin-antitoxin system VapC family toxin [uncultured Enterovirga sp.]|uniref:type II toxin-antitoxin system VapC family toxin n=1 Tax=uncultured Enterovirga sp. TaxID=2026352 RepID=UPI0035CA1B00
MLFLDSNVLLDVFSADERWGEWSARQMARFAGRLDRLLINAIVYAEVSIKLPNQAELDRNLTGLGIRIVEPTRRASFAAGKAFGKYRSSGGVRTTTLPDFLIGAHAADLGLPLVTRDVRRYRTYFPELELVTP